MRSVKLVIGFQGTRYDGWQSQRKGRTIQECFEKNLQRILQEKVSLIGSSRTDSGVHAHAFAAHFRTASKLPDKKIKEALNFYLPRDIVVYSAKTVDPGFHARFSAKSKLYRYEIWASPTRPLFESPYVLWHPRRLDIGRMRKAARHFTGRHDFSAFRDRGDDQRNPVRTIHSLTITKRGKLIRISVRADGFLRHMVRIIVGTLMEVGRGKLVPESLVEILRSKDRSKAGPTARACGLSLVEVRYY